LAKRFGSLVLRRLDQASGAAPEPIEPVAAPDLPRTRMGFPEPIATPDDLARATALLAERLCEKLRKAGLGASRLDLVFSRIDGVAQTIRIGTATPTRDAPHLARMLVEKIETIDPGFGIEAMLLSASLTGRLEARQGLSELCTASAAADLSALVDRLLNRLGPRHIHRVQPVESDVPERSLRRVPVLARVEGADWPDRLPRPPRLFTPPRPVEATALLPDHAPVQFIWRRRPHRVRRADGPERIFGEWWQDAAETWAVRDYFQVEDEAGQRFWLFRRGDGEQDATGDLRWFLHGMFG
jgi:protein ImuB